jgi:hypothetical protein
MTILTYQVLVRRGADGVVATLDELDCLAACQTVPEALEEIAQRASHILQRYIDAAAAPPTPARLSLLPLNLEIPGRSDGVASDAYRCGSAGVGGEERAGSGCVSPRQVEQVLVRQLLTSDSGCPWPRPALENELRELINVGPTEVGNALAHLSATEVIAVNGELISPRRSTKHLDALGILAF